MMLAKPKLPVTGSGYNPGSFDISGGTFTIAANASLYNFNSYTYGDEEVDSTSADPFHPILSLSGSSSDYSGYWDEASPNSFTLSYDSDTNTLVFATAGRLITQTDVTWGEEESRTNNVDHLTEEEDGPTDALFFKAWASGQNWENSSVRFSGMSLSIDGETPRPLGDRSKAGQREGVSSDTLEITGMDLSDNDWEVSGNVLMAFTSASSAESLTISAAGGTAAATTPTVIVPDVTLTEGQKTAGCTWDAKSKVLTITSTTDLTINLTVKNTNGTPKADVRLDTKTTLAPSGTGTDLVHYISSAGNTGSDGAATADFTGTAKTGKYKVKIFDITDPSQSIEITVVVK